MTEFFGSLTTKQKVMIAFVVIGVIVVIMISTGVIKVGGGGGGGDDNDVPSSGDDAPASDSPPGTISGIEFGVRTGEDDGPTESYTTIDEMDGVAVDLSFVTPKTSFGFGNLALKDYVISLGTAKTLDDGRIERESTLALIVIPRTNPTGGTKLITPTINKVLEPEEIDLSGDFNATDGRVNITLGNDIWVAGQIIIPKGGVFLSIDYTSMDLGDDHQYTWSGVSNAYQPVGTSTKKFALGGITLSGDVQDDGGFIVNPDVTDTINEELNIEVEKGDISGTLEIRKQIGKNSRFLISPVSNQTNRFLAFTNGGDGIKASVLGEPPANCFLDRFRDKPTITTDNIMMKLNLSKVPNGKFWQPDSNWYNFAVMEEHQSGWVRLGLISNFEKDGVIPQLGTGIPIIKLAKYPVIHPVHKVGARDTKLSYHKYNKSDDDDNYFNKTYVKFVRPLDSSNHEGGKKFSLCVRRVQGMVPLEGVVSAAVELPKPLTAEDQFLVYEEPNAVLKPLKDISNLSTAVFTRRNPVDGNTPADGAGGLSGAEFWNACFNGDLAAVREALPTATLGVLNWNNGDGRTPLFIAAFNGHEAVVRALLGTGV